LMSVFYPLASPFFFSSRRRHTRFSRDWSSDVCSSDLVEITAAMSIRIGANTMIAAECSINDCDWHGLYNRTRPFRCSKPVVLGRSEERRVGKEGRHRRGAYSGKRNGLMN